eukprot:s445_g9.t1
MLTSLPPLRSHLSSPKKRGQSRVNVASPQRLVIGPQESSLGSPARWIFSNGRSTPGTSSTKRAGGSQQFVKTFDGSFSNSASLIVDVLLTPIPNS